MLRLRGSELEHEVRRETLRIASDLLVQRLGRDAVEVGKVAVQKDPLAAQDQDAPFGALNDDGLD